MAKKQQLDVCSICEQDYVSFISFATTPFVDGKKHKIICHCCLCCLKPYSVANIDLIPCPTNQLRKLKEVVEDGFDANQAKVSLLAMGKILGMKPKNIKELL